MAQSSTSRIPGEQRVFSLVLALVAKPQGITKSELFGSVYGYSVPHSDKAAIAARERQFERDKTQLRELGIPVETIDSPEESGNNQLTRYRITKSRLQMPDSIRFTEDELALLRGAALAWRDGSLTDESRRSIMKLSALGAGFDAQHIGIAPQLGIVEPSAPALRAAITAQKPVRFAYQLPTNDAPQERYVLPLGLHRADGRWHLISYDLERSAGRVFLLSRIVSEVRTEGGGRGGAGGTGAGANAVDIPTGLYDSLVAELEQLEHERRAIIEVESGSVAHARLAARASRVTLVAQAANTGATTGNVAAVSIELGTLDYAVLAAELVRYADDIRSIEPRELHTLTSELLTRIRDHHGVNA